MKVRIKGGNEVGTSNKFNMSSSDEVIVFFNNYLDSYYISDLEVCIDNKWMSMSDAFNNHDLITDNHNTVFFEPLNDDERRRGYRKSEYDLYELKAQLFDFMD